MEELKKQDEIVRKETDETLENTIDNINNAVSELKSIMSNIHKLSRAECVYNTNKPFKTIDSEKFNYITERISQINEKMYVFSKASSQLNKKLMTLTMLFPADSVYRVLYQILVQIEDRQQAIISNINNIKKTYMSLVSTKNKLQKYPENDSEKLMLELELQDLQIGLANSFSYLEAAIKEVGYYIETYEEIKKNKNIPDDWDEYDYEKDEIRANIMSAFRNCIRDHLVHGTIGMGTCEYVEQLGISPIEAQYHTRRYLESCNIKIQNGQLPDYDDMYDFLENMANLYKNAYKKVCKKIGIDDDFISRRFTLITNKNNLEKLKQEMLEENKE